MSKQFALVAAILGGMLAFGCEEKKDVNTPTVPKEVKNNAEDAAKNAERTGDAMTHDANKAAEATKDATKDAADATEDATKKAAEATADATKAVNDEAQSTFDHAMKYVGDMKLADAEPLIKKLEGMDSPLAKQLAAQARAAYDKAKAGAGAAGNALKDLSK